MGNFDSHEYYVTSGYLMIFQAFILPMHIVALLVSLLRNWKLSGLAIYFAKSFFMFCFCCCISRLIDWNHQVRLIGNE